jgi:spore coat polysaccharide biosynthesis protein SpsF
MANSRSNQTQKIVCIVQARMGSSRLPGKVLKDICGFPMLDWVIHRAQLASSINAIMVATTTDQEDDPIADWCIQNGITFYRGSALDVLDRFYQAAVSVDADVIVRLTADCPLIDPAVIDEVVGALLDRQADFAANRLPPPFHRTFPIGLDVEVVTFTALERAWQDAKEQFEREHVLPYLYKDVGKFNVFVLDAKEDYGALRWTVDTPQDLEFIRALTAAMECARDASWLTVLDFLQDHPEITAINSGVAHKSFTDIDHRALSGGEDNNG